MRTLALAIGLCLTFGSSLAAEKKEDTKVHVKKLKHVHDHEWNNRKAQ
jgi:hypothetical protein